MDGLELLGQRMYLQHPLEASTHEPQYIFADDTYSKPYFVTYINTSAFAISLLPVFIKIAHEQGFAHIKANAYEYWRGKGALPQYQRAPTEDNGSFKAQDDEDNLEGSMYSSSHLLMSDHTGPMSGNGALGDVEGVLSVRETAKLSLEFCMLWFLANYFVAACLKYTSVASSTILTSTSSIWTLLLGALIGVESFSVKKLIGVMASLAGIILISSVDLSGDNDENRGSFPHKSQEEIAIGDAMAIFSALMYGIYTVVMKKRIGNEDRVNMPLFFGLVGLFNVLLLWPGFIVLHYTGVETFELPPNGKIWAIVIVSMDRIPLSSISSKQQAIGQLFVFPDQRFLLGICHASDYTTSGNSGPVTNDTFIPYWTNDFEFTILKRPLLGRGRSCVPLILIHKS